MSNFESILNRGWSELPEPVPVPDGKWLLKGKFAGAYAWKSNETGEEGARIVITNEAVKPADAETAAEVTDPETYKGAQVETTFYVLNVTDERKVWEHLAVRGIDLDEVDNLEDALKKVRGTTVIGSVRTRNYETKDGGQGFRNFTVKTEAVSL